MKLLEPTVDQSKFKELHKHKGSKNYEIVEIVPKQNEADYFELDTISDYVFVNSFFESLSKKREEIEYRTLKLDLLGNQKDSFKAHSKLKDGTLWNNEYYVNWLIDGDTVKYRYTDPFSNKEIDDPYEFEAKEKDIEKWLKKFIEIYSQAQYAYIDISKYYFKVNAKWYFMEAELEGLPEDLQQKYPPKEDQDVRMIELQDLAPEFYHEGHPKRDTSLIKMVAYESAYFEKVDEGLNQYNFSAGWWYLEIPMPLGDTIRIKRYSNYEDPELLIYKVPGAYGGREDVLFIIQKPEELFPDQVGGMYAIRPRDPEQPQRRYKSISYGDTSKGQPHILRAEETEEYKQWKSTRKD